VPEGIGDGSCILDILQLNPADSNEPGDKYIPDCSVPDPQGDPIGLPPGVGLNIQFQYFYPVLPFEFPKINKSKSALACFAFIFAI